MHEVISKITSLLQNEEKNAMIYLDGFEKREQLERIQGFKVISFDKIGQIPPKTKKEEVLTKNIRLRVDGRWEARKTILGHKINIIKNTLAECKKAFKEKLNALKKKDVKSENGGYTLYEWGEYWINTYKKNFVAENTTKEMFISFKKVKGREVDINLKDLTTSKLQQFLNKFPNNRSKEILILHLNASLKRAVKEKLIKSNPMEDVEKAKKIKSIRKPFTYEEQAEILKAINGTEIENQIKIFLFTGIRKGEFNFKSIEKDIQDDGMLKVACEKKRSAVPTFRYIDITPKTKNLILDYANQDKKINSDVLSDRFREILTALNFPKGYGLHTLRHTFTTNHFYLGTPDKFVQEWLGHEDIAVTKKHYTAIDRTLSKENILSLYDGYFYEVK